MPEQGINMPAVEAGGARGGPGNRTPAMATQLKVKLLGDAVAVVAPHEINVDVDAKWWKEIDYGDMKVVLVRL